MTKRGFIGLGMIAGLLWSVAVLWIAARYVTVPIFALIPTIMTGFLAPGIVMLLMIARLAQRRFFDDAIIDGQPFATGSGAGIDQRVLKNTTEQLAIGLCIWPAAAVILADKGPGVILVLGLNFAFARIFFWIGYHISPPLRAFGFATSFYPTVLVTLWTVWSLLAYGQ